MSSRGLGGGGGSQTKRRERWLLGSLAGCGDADLRANKAHELFDLHVSTGPEDVAAGWDMLSAGLIAGTPIYVETEGTSTSIYKCFKGPKTCRDGGNIDLRVNTRHEHFDSHVFQGSQDVPNAGWLSGCGDVGLRVNRGHEHLDSHVFQSR